MGSSLLDLLNRSRNDYGWEVLHHVPYSPDMSPPDFELFPKLKKPICGRVTSLEELSTDVT